jgi:hypothetical protein
MNGDLCQMFTHVLVPNEKKRKQHKHNQHKRKHVSIPMYYSPLPNPPQLPQSFSWKGRYIVPDLHTTVPFVWYGKNGNVQMIAGTTSDPIYFTNFINQGNLYTYTYAWPGLQPSFLPPLESCDPIPFTFEQLNGFLAHSARFVGKEVLQERKVCRYVNHFRVAVVLPKLPPGFYLRIPITCVDLYVDQEDSTVFWKVLQFGFQNLYDPELNEYIVIDKIQCPIPDLVLPPKCVTESKTNEKQDNSGDNQSFAQGTQGRQGTQDFEKFSSPTS